MAFDPDAYLAKKKQSTGFDPDTYLSKKLIPISERGEDFPRPEEDQPSETLEGLKGAASEIGGAFGEAVEGKTGLGLIKSGVEETKSFVKGAADRAKLLTRLGIGTPGEKIKAFKGLSKIAADEVKGGVNLLKDTVRETGRVIGIAVFEGTGEAAKEIVKDLADIGYKMPITTAATVLGISPTTRKAVGLTTKAVINLKSKIKNKIFPDMKKIKKTRVGIMDEILSTNKTNRRVLKKHKKMGLDSLNDIAETDILPGSIDDNLTIQLQDKIDNFQTEIQPTEGILTRLLSRSNEKIHKVKLRMIMNDTINDFFEGGGPDLKAALKKGLENVDDIVTDSKGFVSLKDVQKAKIFNTGKVSQWGPGTDGLQRKALGSAFRESIEISAKSINVKKINRELSRQYAMLEVLELLNNKKVNQGRLGKRFASIGGSIVGTAFGGPGGGIAGYYAGPKILSSIAKRQFKKGGSPAKASDFLLNLQKK